MLRGILNYSARYLRGGRQERRRVRHEVGLKLRGIDVSAVELDELKLSVERSKPHSASGGPDLADVLDELGLARTAEALDLGCGKGGALLTLGKRFDRVAGVDLSEELLTIAARNLKKCGMTAELVRADAEEFADYDRYTLVYMFNPFPSPVMDAAMRNLAESLRRRPRPFWLIYKNPLYHEAVVAAGFRVVREFPCGELPFRVYQRA